MRARYLSLRATWGLLLACGTTTMTTAAEDVNGVTWQYPSGGETFYYLDTVQVTYTSNFPEPLLYSFCADGSGNAIQKKLDEATPYNGTVPTVLDWADASSACWFGLRPGHEAALGANSEPFTYNIGRRKRTTLGPRLTSEETSSTAATIAADAISSSSPTSATATAAASTRLSTGAQAGIGVGAALAGLALGALAATMFLRRRDRSQRVADGHQYAGAPATRYPGSDYQGPAGYGPSPTTLYSGQSGALKSQPPTPMELATERAPVELDGRWRTH